MRARIAVLSASLLLLVGCDHASKAWAEASLPSRSVELVANVLDLTYTRNHDVAFNLLRWLPAEAQTPVALVSATLATVVLLVFWLRRRDASKIEHAAFALVFAGALGNLIDRGMRGYVVDFIHVHHWPVFNVADVLIVAGTILLAFVLARDGRKQRADSPG